MNGVKRNLSDFISRLKAKLRQDKKKTVILVILLIVAGLVGGRLVVSHSLPDDASAAGSGGVAQSLLPDADGNVPPGQVGKTNSQTQQVDLASMDRTINRDLFWPDTKYFPSADQDDTHPVVVQPDQAQQLAEAEQREQRKRMEHIKSIRAQAEALSLTSTMLGRSPTALINGQVLRTGEMINGFCLESIAPDGCIVSREGVDVELQMRE